MQLMQVRRAFS